MTPPPAGTAVPDLPGLSSLSPLGRGGFADVYLAHQVHLDRWVAAKVFRVALADKRASEQFRAECQAVGRLDRHPHVITVYEANVLPDGRPYMVTEHCDGSLQQLLAANGALPASRVVDIGLTVARALLFAHSARVLHGDVTPQNILLRASGAPVLADFGLAVLRDYQGNVASGFTMAHAAPETVRYDGAIDERTDVYALGSTLYTALTGRPPFPSRPGQDDAARAHRILTEAPTAPAPAAAPSGLSRLLLGMLAKAPAERPSMTEAADALSALQDGSGSAEAHTPEAAAGGPVAGGPEAGDRGPSYLSPTAPPGRPDPSGAGSPHGVLPGPSSPPEPATGPGPRVAPDPPVYTAPAGTEAYRPAGRPSGEDTRIRPGAQYAPPIAPGGEQTRRRPHADPAHAAGAGAARPRRRPWILVAVAGVVVVLAGVGAVALWPTSDNTPPAGSPAAVAPITLAPPVDRGDTIELSWTADAPLDFAVVVGEEGRPEAETTIVERVTSYTVPVEPGRPYCFRVQGATSAGAVSQSNVQSVRNAVCRFDP